MRRKATLYEVTSKRAGSLRKGLLAVEYLVTWGRASDVAGRPLEVEEYGEAVGISRAQAFRRQAAWRSVFQHENDATPERMWKIARPLLDKSAPTWQQVAQACALVPGGFEH